MTQVFARVSYDVLFDRLFKSLSNYIGHFKIEQTMQQSHDKVFDIWFYTDAVQIPEGKSRQVEIECTSQPNGEFTFKIIYNNL